MKLEQSFEVAAPIDRVWNALIDVEHVAPCLPGATVTGRNEDGSYTGTLTIKIGPTTAAYAGKLEMEQIDEGARTATMHAHGTDKRGQGGAKATISSTLSETGDGHPRRGRHRLPHHRSPGPLRARRNDRGHLRAAAAGVRQRLQASLADHDHERWRHPPAVRVPAPRPPPLTRRPRTRDPRPRSPPSRPPSPSPRTLTLTPSR